ncbi:glycosyltransferase involved in cell wall biosynthesis [Ilumatobacter fluminis]|uniref:Glycosyltransferase involved in cell wall biosynthesis n=1 Tax=Ilumatobacter fluminis TaxID=467091 RepID=A0A4R7HZD0_9ACTN|nr:glycosyltransferase involved in cell wall biosynthesis [Ilumatobacter fluminis]
MVCHEWLAVLGGSDKVAAELAGVAEADVVYTFAVDAGCVDELGFDAPVVTWRLGRWAGRSRRFTLLLPIMPIVWWALDLGHADLVVTSSHSCVNSIRTPAARRVSYCHTPMRYAWDWRLERERMPRPLRPLMPIGAAAFRRLDRRWSSRVDTYIANSSFVAGRIAAAYGRADAVVIPPPIDVAAPEPGRVVDADVVPDVRYFVTAGRWVPYKRFDLAIEAAVLAERTLVVAGGGPDAARLRLAAGPTVRFVDEPDDSTLWALLGAADAFLFCGVEDFGMLPVEAQATGTPVVARDEGGALDSVIDGESGTLVHGDDPLRWAEVLRAFDPDRFDAERIRAHAASFGSDVFRRRVGAVVAGRPVETTG